MSGFNRLKWLHLTLIFMADSYGLPQIAVNTSIFKVTDSTQHVDNHHFDNIIQGNESKIMMLQKLRNNNERLTNDQDNDRSRLVIECSADMKIRFIECLEKCTNLSCWPQEKQNFLSACLSGIKQSCTTEPSQPIPPSTKRLPGIKISKCDDGHILDYGEATIIYSDDDSDAKKRCRSAFISPEGTTMQLECPMFSLHFDGCKKERLLVNEKGKIKNVFCKTVNPDTYESSSNNMAIIYVLKANIRSLGFICKVTVIGERPTTTTRKNTWTTTTSNTTPSTRPTIFSTWWPPGTYWTDQTWSDGTNFGFPFPRTTTPMRPTLKKGGLKTSNGDSKASNGTTWISVTL